MDQEKETPKVDQASGEAESKQTTSSDAGNDVANKEGANSENQGKRQRTRIKVTGQRVEHAFSLKGESLDIRTGKSSVVKESTTPETNTHDRDEAFNKLLKDNSDFLANNPVNTNDQQRSNPNYKRVPLERTYTESSSYSNNSNNRNDASEGNRYARSARTPRFADKPAVASRATGDSPSFTRRNNGGSNRNTNERNGSRKAAYGRNKSYERGEKAKANFGTPRANNNNNAKKGKPNVRTKVAKKIDKSKLDIQPAPDFIPTYADPTINNTTPIRLNKYLSNAGICSRRNADTLIAAGKVKVNGQVVTTMGTEVMRQDVIEYNGQIVSIERKVYVVLNKPKNCVTTADDPEGRITVMDLVKNACPERIYPVGRLDRNTTGVLLLTNDGDMMAKLVHPAYKKKKIYQVTLDKPVAVEHMKAIATGIVLSDGPIHADAISYVDSNDFSVVGIELHSGRNRIVRRIFEHFGYKVWKLDRVYFAGLTKRNLPRGRWRFLTEEEVNHLRMGNYN